MSAQTPGRDNRRLIVRVLSQQVLQLLTYWARRNGEDLIAVLVFTAVWTANTQHISPRPSLRYGELRDIPPDSLRRPVPLADLPDLVCLPRAMVTVYVRDLVSRGLIEETEGGLVVPTAVLARLDSVENLTATYDRLLDMIAALREAGLKIEDERGPNPI